MKSRLATELGRGSLNDSPAAQRHLHRLRETVVHSAMVITLTILVIFVALPPVLAQGSLDTHLNDSGVQPGRGPQGASDPPAAFSGTERPDTASFQMNVPLVSLAGRGLGVNLSLHYDSSLYQLSPDSPDHFRVDSNRTIGFPFLSYDDTFMGWPGYGFSLGYGMLIFHNARILNCQTYVIPATTYCGGVFFPPATIPPGSQLRTFIDGTGARHRMETGSVDSADLLLRLESGTPTITYPDGTKMIFGRMNLALSYNTPIEERQCPDNGVIRRSCKVYDEVYFPTRIVDRNGNYIQIDYVPNVAGLYIQSITDTLGRRINFNYGTNGLASISVPDFNNGDSPQRTVVQFSYQNLPFSGCFLSQGCLSGTVKVLSSVYFPATNTGWQYSYSSFGMMYRVEKLAAMNVDASGNVTGQVIAKTEYDYPGTPLNPANNLPVQLPNYATRTDQWVDVQGVLSPPLVHYFHVDYFSTNRTSVATITSPDQTTKSEITRRWYLPFAHDSRMWWLTWDEGLILRQKITKNDKTYLVVDQNWGGEPTAGGPVLRDQTITDDAGATRKTIYEYCPGPAAGEYGVFDNVCKVFEYTFNSTTFDSTTEIKRTEYVYEADPGWTNRWLVKLVKSMKVFQGGSAQPLAQVDFSYDANPLTSYSNLPGTYDANTPAQRGNLTNVSGNTNASSPNDGVTIAATMNYDVFGNVIQSIDPKGKTLQLDFGDSFSDGQVRNTYAYQTAMTSDIPDSSGVHGSTAPFRQSRVYNFATGLVTYVTDLNMQSTTNEYSDPANRITKITRPDGGWTANEYSDIPGNLYVKTLAVQQQAPTQQILEARQYFDGKGRNVRSFNAEGSSWLVTDMKYDEVNRTVSISNPYRTASLNEAINPSNNWTTVVYDPLGRSLSVTTPDGAQTRTDYLGAMAMTTDPAGQRRLVRSDELDRLTDVWEIISAPSTESVVFGDQTLTGYHTTYFFDVLANLRSVTQGTQQRFFCYDSLSRLIRVKNPEQDSRASLALTDPLTGHNDWSAGYSYENNGNLATRTDARGVVTTYDYDGVSRLISRTYTDGTPAVTYSYDSATIANGKGRLASVSSSVSSYNYSGYDAVGRALGGAQTIGGQSYPVGYTYDKAGHVLTENYPSGRIVTNTYDNAGRLSSFSGNLGDSSQRAYATGISYDSAGHWTREQFGTNTPLYNKRRYNVRQQLYDVRLSTVNDVDNGNRGNIANYYNFQNFGFGTSGTDNNGKLLIQQVWIPTDDQVSGYTIHQQNYDYDSLNRLRWMEEYLNAAVPGTGGQSYSYDRYGNRTVSGYGAGINTQQFEMGDAQNSNRLYAPGDLSLPMNQRRMQYDPAGNLTYDSYGGQGQRVYDAENHMTRAWANGQWQTYTYDGDGHRVKRSVNGAETWQVYGLGGELLAEYAANAAASSPQKEYGYRNGDLLIVTTAYVPPPPPPPPLCYPDGEGGFICYPVDENPEPPQRTLEWLVTDQLGTPRMIADETGSLAGVSRHDYLPFGEELYAGISSRTWQQGYTGDNVRQKFTGYEKDNETNLDFAQARHYSNAQGRFTSPDPALTSGEPLLPQSWNRYSYTLNNPLVLIDPSGLIWGTRNGQISWYASSEGMVANGATEWTQEYYQDKLTDKWVHLRMAGPTHNPGDSDFDRQGWGYVDARSVPGEYNHENMPAVEANTGPPPVETPVCDCCRCSLYQKYEYESLADYMRKPDAVQLNLNFITQGHSFSLDSKGKFYMTFEGVPRNPYNFSAKTLRGVARGGASFSLVWLNQADSPTGEQMETYFTGPSVGGGGMIWRGLGGGLSWTPGSGTATHLGLYSPGVTVSGGTGIKVTDTRFRWR